MDLIPTGDAKYWLIIYGETLQNIYLKCKIMRAIEWKTLF